MICKVVVDTNVVISSRLSATGNPAEIMKLIADGKADLYYSEGILEEYKRVLAYEKFKFDVELQKRAIEDIENIGYLINPIKSGIPLPHESDRIFYDTAKTLCVKTDAYLITGNIKHFPKKHFILTPAQFVTLYERQEIE